MPKGTQFSAAGDGLEAGIVEAIAAEVQGSKHGQMGLCGQSSGTVGTDAVGAQSQLDQASGTLRRHQIHHTLWAEGVVAKEMEAAAIARMARDLGIPFLAVKAVTDLVDHPEEEHVSFLQNYEEVTSLLSNRLQSLVAWLSVGRGVGSLAI